MVRVFVAAALVAGMVGPATAAADSFDDVSPNAYYADAVAWLADQEITTGTSDTSYSPDQFVTRGQMAAFLARYGGNPGGNPSSSFDDVAGGVFYSDPIGWIASHGITTGTSATTYSPDAFVTRGQMAAFLWRFAGRAPSDEVVPFVDVAPNSYYGDAVAWLVERNITTGTTGTTYSPDDFVTRGQMAAFLWRLAGEPTVGNNGSMRVAANQIGASGGTVTEGGITISIAGLTGGASVRAEVADADALPATAGTVSGGPIEITISGAELTGPALLTIPVDAGAAVDGATITVHILASNNTWVTLTTSVTVEQIDGEWFATFDISSGVPLSTAITTAGLGTLGTGGDFSRYIVHVTAEPPPATTTQPPSDGPLAIWTDGIGLALGAGTVGEPYQASIGGSGGVLPYFTLQIDEASLPPGLSAAMGIVEGRLTATISGTPTTHGAYYFSASVVDNDGLIVHELVTLTIRPEPEPFAITQVSTDYYAGYPTVTSTGSHAFWNPGSGLRLFDRAASAITVQDFADPDLTADGTYAVWVDGLGVHRRNLATNVTVTVAAEVVELPSWGDPNFQSAQVSDDGRFVYFMSDRDDLGGETDTNSAFDHFVWDATDSSITQITNGDVASGFGSISADGRYLAFSSGAENLIAPLPPSPGPPAIYSADLFVWDRTTGSMTQATDDATGGVQRPLISADGSVVYFESSSPTLLGPDGNANYDIFAWERVTETLHRVTNGSRGSPFGVYSPAVSADGSRLVFVSSETELTADVDTGYHPDVFLWEVATQTVTLVAPSTGLYGYETGVDISADGSTVAMMSNASDLTPGNDLNGGADLFLWDVEANLFARVTRGLYPTYGNVHLSDDGTIVYFGRNGLAFADLTAPQ